MRLGILFLGHLPCNLFGRKHIRHVWQQFREAYLNERYNSRACRGNQRPGIGRFKHLAHGCRNDVRCARHLEYIAEAQRKQGVEHVVHTCDVAELPVKRRRRKCDAVLVAEDRVDRIRLRNLCIVRTDAHAYAAIDAQLI